MYTHAVNKQNTVAGRAGAPVGKIILGGMMMTELRVESFAHLDDPVETFLALPRKLEGLGDAQARAETAGTRALLDPGNSFYQSGDSRCFLAHRGDRPVGRLTAFRNRLLEEKEGPIGLVGHFSCEEDTGVVRALVDAAADWLSKQGIKTLRGPMAGDIWHRWRFMTDGFDMAPFPGEPRQPQFYPELFTAAGFHRVRTWVTKSVRDLEAQLGYFKAGAALNRKRGYTFRNFDRDRWDEDVSSLYELCKHSFAITWGTTDTTLEEFTNIYDRWLRRVGPDHILLSEDPKGRVVGLGLAIAAPESTLNIRTLAVLPDQHGYGLGQAIAAELYRRALEAGVEQVHHCLMGPATPPLRWDRGLGRVTREYAMYERGIG